MPITITDSNGDVRSENWPPADELDAIMLDKTADAKRKSAQDAYDAAKAARGGLKSYTWIGEPMLNNTRRMRINNTTGAIETIDL